MRSVKILNQSLAEALRDEAQRIGDPHEARALRAHANRLERRFPKRITRNLKGI